MARKRRFYRSRWFRTLISMLLVGFGLVAVMQATGNESVIPAALFYGAAAGPVALLVATHDRTGIGFSVHPATLLGTFLFGGGAAVTFAAFFDVELPAWEWVGFVEEAAKLLVPIGIAATGRYLFKASGVALGLAAATGFAVLETMSYGLTSLLQDGIVAGELTLLVRMLTTPFSHLAWTGLVCAVWFGVWERRGRIAVTLPVIGAYLLAALLHTFNDALLQPAAQGWPIWSMLLFPVIAAMSYTAFRLATRDLKPATGRAAASSPAVPAVPAQGRHERSATEEVDPRT